MLLATYYVKIIHHEPIISLYCIFLCTMLMSDKAYQIWLWVLLYFFCLLKINIFMHLFLLKYTAKLNRRSGKISDIYHHTHFNGASSDKFDSNLNIRSSYATDVYHNANMSIFRGYSKDVSRHGLVAIMPWNSEERAFAVKTTFQADVLLLHHSAHFGIALI